MTAAAHLRGVAVDVGKVPATAAAVIAQRVATLAAAEARRAGVGTMHLSRRGRPDRTVTLRVVATTRTQGNATVTMLQGLPVGPWVWADSGTRPHRIGVDAARHASRRGAFLLLPGGIRRAPLPHPGSRGRRVWDRIAREVGGESVDAVTAAVHGAVS